MNYLFVSVRMNMQEKLTFFYCIYKHDKCWGTHIYGNSWMLWKLMICGTWLKWYQALIIPIQLNQNYYRYKWKWIQWIEHVRLLIPPPTGVGVLCFLGTTQIVWMTGFDHNIKPACLVKCMISVLDSVFLTL